MAGALCCKVCWVAFGEICKLRPIQNMKRMGLNLLYGSLTEIAAPLPHANSYSAITLLLPGILRGVCFVNGHGVTSIFKIFINWRTRDF